MTSEDVLGTSSWGSREPWGRIRASRDEAPMTDDAMRGLAVDPLRNTVIERRGPDDPWA